MGKKNAVKRKNKRLGGATALPSVLKKRLDSAFSRYIRLKYADADGFVECYTCGIRKEWKKMQCGHFVSRQYLSLRWDENNCRPQDVGCNIWGNGKFLDFEERLKKELGAEVVEKLKQRRHDIVKRDYSWYNEQIQCYEKKVSQLTKKLGI